MEGAGLPRLWGTLRDRNHQQAHRGL